MLEDMIRMKRIDGVQDALTAIAEATLADGKLPDLSGQLGEIKVPVLGIWGAKDQVIAPPDIAALKESLAVEVLDDAGHMAHMEAANRVNDLIVAVLEEQD